MIESVIHYKPEYLTDEAGRRINFRYDRGRGEFVRDDDGDLIPIRAAGPTGSGAITSQPAGHLGRDRQAARLPG
jgi:hypothetical protein